MRSSPRSWLGIACGLLVCAGFLVLTLWRSDSGITLVLVLLGSAVLVLFVSQWVTARIGGWDTRQTFLEHTEDWSLVVPATSTRGLMSELREKTNAKGHEWYMPWGLTLTANPVGIALWSGEAPPDLRLWLPWSDVERVSPTTTRGLLNGMPAIGVRARINDHEVEIAIPIMGGFPFGAQPASASRVDDISDELCRMHIPE